MYFHGFYEIKISIKIFVVAKHKIIACKLLCLILSTIIMSVWDEIVMQMLF